MRLHWLTRSTSSTVVSKKTGTVIKVRDIIAPVEIMLVALDLMECISSEIGLPTGEE